MANVGTETPTVARRRNSSGESTRVMLMEVAERLFATRGIEAVTLREIQQAAGQSNTSVIRYHFGSRDGLIRSLIAHRQHGLGADRQDMLARMRDEGK
jgi:AcrR family transcriptional regulator